MRATFLRLAAFPSRLSAPPGGAKLVRELLKEHGPLSSQKLFALGTEGYEPVPRPTVLLDENGKPVMKKAPNVRGGMKPVVPEAVAPHPDHPFLSMRHFKGKVLSALEARGLIYRARQLVPHRNEEDRRAAAKLAAKMTLSMQRKALERKEPPPPPVEASSLSAEYVWKLGPAPDSTVAPASVERSWESIQAAELAGGSSSYKHERAAERQADMRRVPTELRESRNEGQVHRRKSWTDGKEPGAGFGLSRRPDNQLKMDQRSPRWDTPWRSDFERPRAFEHDSSQASPRKPFQTDRSSERNEKRQGGFGLKKDRGSDE